MSTTQQISIIWSVEDVQMVAPDLTEEQCSEVLDLVKHNHDAEIGVNWYVLEFWADQVRDKQGSVA